MYLEVRLHLSSPDCSNKLPTKVPECTLRFAAPEQLKQLPPAAHTIILGKQFPEQPPAKLVDETRRIKMDKALSNNPTVSISNTVPNSHSQTIRNSNNPKDKINAAATF